MANVYFLDAGDRTTLAGSWEGKNVVLVTLVMLKIKCYCCNLGKEEKEVLGIFYLWILFVII